jgi:hypothetical protein
MSQPAEPPQPPAVEAPAATGAGSDVVHAAVPSTVDTKFVEATRCVQTAPACPPQPVIVLFHRILRLAMPSQCGLLL